MKNCPHTKLTVPECSCNHCIERQLSDFAPHLITVRRNHVVPPPAERITVRRNDVVPLPAHGQRDRETPSVAERLSRPSL